MRCRGPETRRDPCRGPFRRRRGMPAGVASHTAIQRGLGSSLAVRPGSGSVFSTGRRSLLEQASAMPVQPRFPFKVPRFSIIFRIKGLTGFRPARSPLRGRTTCPRSCSGERNRCKSPDWLAGKADMETGRPPVRQRPVRVRNRGSVRPGGLRPAGRRRPPGPGRARARRRGPCRALRRRSSCDRRGSWCRPCSRRWPAAGPCGRG